MTSKLYVGNLPFTTTVQDIQDLFSQSGNVSAIDLIYDKFTGRSRGFAFVNMSTPEEAKTTMDRFHGFNVGGRSLTVTEARPKEPRMRTFSDSPSAPRGDMPERGGDKTHSRRDHKNEREYNR